VKNQWGQNLSNVVVVQLAIVGLIIDLTTAGCAAKGAAPRGEPGNAGTVQEAVVVEKPPEATANREEGSAAKPPEAQAPHGKAGGVQAEAPLAAPSDKIAVPALKADVPAAKTATQPRAAPAPTDPAPKVASRAPVPEKPPAPPPLDLTSLEKRLRETDAIGVFTKLTLKNQVDDLLDRFRAHYEGKTKTSLLELRQPFDLLMLKVLSLLQDRDSSLASAILASREAMWSILSDPVKFQDVVVQNRG
jgi:hypothetical protein